MAKLICNKCKQKASPRAICYECKKIFCFQDIWGGQVNDKMKETDEIRDICDSCKEKYNYRLLDEELRELRR